MKFFAATIVLGMAAVAVAQDSSSSLSVYEQCLEDKCPNSKEDVSCQAACKGNPNPNASMIAETNECYKGCIGLDYQGAIDCQAKCNNIYNPANTVVTGHLVPAGVSTGSGSAVSAATSSTAAISSTAANTAAESSANAESSADVKSSSKAASDAESELDDESASSEDEESSSLSSKSKSSSSSASTLKAALSGVALVAAAALF
ncbi:hypothetical protein LPJ66_003186 [Kickxella alabastrina]|uniref:Uncharacterized protein n=1 Tax=Kickxella alabastrina TaxID=61397 RepID=A0ACC1ILD4_9FUNG|nr:hypothetical protein LPJ66_003186 [Kickxella alabastrina]